MYLCVYICITGRSSSRIATCCCAIWKGPRNLVYIYVYVCVYMYAKPEEAAQGSRRASTRFGRVQGIQYYI